LAALAPILRFLRSQLCSSGLGRFLALALVAAAGSDLLRQGPLLPPASAQQPAISAGMVTIESDRQQADNRTGILTATGNVRITYPDRRMVATSRQAQYFSREGVLVLTGDVDVIDADGQRLRGERVVYRVDSERLQVDPQAGRQVFSRFRLQQGPQAMPAAKP
jgi:lipopolysaccharide export system protein LptA